MLRVGDWNVEPALNCLAASGKSVKLEAKAMSVLVYLAERPGQVVSRQELLSAVWPGVVVGDDSLTQVVLKLRRALGDAPDHPTYIQTIAKRGYRLVAPVTTPDESVSSPGMASAASVKSVRARRLPWLAAAGVLASVATAVAVTAWVRYEGGASPVAPSGADAEVARGSQPTVAVRPFEAEGNDAHAVLLARGITADLVTDLSKVQGLSVIGSASPGGNAAYLVSGSVQSADKRLRIHVHLTDARSGKQVWSERFDRAPGDFFAMQDEIGPKLLHVLPAKVSEAELRRVAQRHTRNLEAYEYFQRGQAALLVRQRAENEVARGMFRRAIELDAAFARAYAGLALTYAADYRNQWTGDGAAALERAFELARTAYGINPDIAETCWVLAFVHLERKEHDQALRHLETALRLSPSFADAYALMGGIKTYVGRPQDTVPLLRTAMRLSPDAGHLYFLLLGRAYLFLGDHEQARINLEQALGRNPVNVESHVYMAVLHVMAGHKAEAAWEAEEIRALQPGFSGRAWLETHPMTDAAQRAKLAKALGELGF